MSPTRICLIAAAILGLNGCTRGGDTPLPPPPAASASPVSALPTAPVAAPVASKITAPVVKQPVPTAKPPKPAAPVVASLALDLNALKTQLKETKAIGIFSKIALKNQVDDLMKQFHDFYQGKTNTTMTELHRSYDLLMMKVLSLVQDHDQKLASAIVSSREAIWNLLADPKKFATLES